MQHLKNIKSGNPKTKEQYQLTKNFDVIWLWSEDGKNWYEEVKNFQPDTIKIVYDANNIIVAITKDASTLNPEGYWICPYISRHLLSLNPLLACCRRYSRGER
ncbi:hypothetical protein ESCOMMO164M2_22725 [Escherichia coli]